MPRSKVTNDNNGTLALLGSILKTCLDSNYEPNQPEDRLLVAVLDRALRDLELKDQSTRLQARSYFMSDSTDENGLDFIWICKAIGCDYLHFRKELVRRGLI